MNKLAFKNNLSLVNLILPKDSIESVSRDLQKAGSKEYFHVAARGSIITEGGFLPRCFRHLLPSNVWFRFWFPSLKS